VLELETTEADGSERGVMVELPEQSMGIELVRSDEEGFAV
jgi:hypothetical protein